MEEFKDILSGTYYFSIPNYDGTFVRCSVAVSVVAQTDKSYRIVLRYPIRNHCAGDKLWVAKKNVRIDKPKSVIETENYWYNKD